jgi:hypothetical protein
MVGGKNKHGVVNILQLWTACTCGCSISLLCLDGLCHSIEHNCQHDRQTSSEHCTTHGLGNAIGPNSTHILPHIHSKAVPGEHSNLSPTFPACNEL